MNEQEYYIIREQIIEASFYISKYMGERDYKKVQNYRNELNRLIDEVITMAPYYPRKPKYDF